MTNPVPDPETNPAPSGSTLPDSTIYAKGRLAAITGHPCIPDIDIRDMGRDAEDMWIDGWRSVGHDYDQVRYLTCPTCPNCHQCLGLSDVQMPACAEVMIAPSGVRVWLDEAGNWRCEYCHHTITDEIAQLDPKPEPQQPDRRQYRILRVLEYTGTREFIDRAIERRTVKGHHQIDGYKTKSGHQYTGVIREAVLGDTVELLDNTPTPPPHYHTIHLPSSEPPPASTKNQISVRLTHEAECGVLGTDDLGLRGAEQTIAVYGEREILGFLEALARYRRQAEESRADLTYSQVMNALHRRDIPTVHRPRMVAALQDLGITITDLPEE